MAHTTRRFTDATAFEAATQDFLLAEEAANNLFFGVIGTLIDQPSRYPGPNDMVVVMKGKVPVLVGLRTPPYNLIVSRGPEAAVEALADHMVEQVAAGAPALPGVLTDDATARVFLKRWEALRGERGKLRDPQRIYRLSEVEAPTGVRGRARQASEADLERVTGWLQAFDTDIKSVRSSQPAEAYRADAARRIAAGEVVLWEVDGEVVSMAARCGWTPNGARIGYVFTPAEHRCCGYGSAVTASCSQAQLDTGRHFCFLFTDLNNPTTNRIYQAIGYEPVCDMNVYGIGGG